MGIAETLKKIFTNRPDIAESSLRREVKAADKGTEFLVHSPVSKKFEKELRKIAKKRGVNIRFTGKRYSFRAWTLEDEKREKEQEELRRHNREEY